MKKLITLAVLLGGLFTLSGCATPPATKISFNPATKQFDLYSPKQVIAKSIKATLPDRTVVDIEGLDSENSAAVLTVLMQQNIAQGQQILQLTDKLNALIATGAAKAATGGVAP